MNGDAGAVPAASTKSRLVGPAIFTLQIMPTSDVKVRCRDDRFSLFLMGAKQDRSVQEDENAVRHGKHLYRGQT
jgi:hypothetical protein